jgi:hypothetical protein
LFSARLIAAQLKKRIFLKPARLIAARLKERNFIKPAQLFEKKIYAIIGLRNYFLRGYWPAQLFSARLLACAVTVSPRRARFQLVSTVDCDRIEVIVLRSPSCWIQLLRLTGMLASRNNIVVLSSLTNG